ncbi:suppressor of fused domain protein [Kitasatospora cystarginea]|uniref:suppressor of fused domain protein n=1 Tax=Kitasatospora cystarginea TaxID=58350 RepID=UPI0031D995F8
MACFREGQLPGTQAFATIDLSRTPLWHPTSDRHFHLELLACENISRTNGYGRVPEVLEYVAGQPTASGEAILHGDVVALPAPLPGGTMTSLYAGLPAYFDDDFSSVTIENGIDVAVVWLIPITAEETAFIRDRRRARSPGPRSPRSRPSPSSKPDARQRPGAASLPRQRAARPTRRPAAPSRQHELPPRCGGW